ncbi:MAG: hypothetical protein HYT16_00405 [DPANN group archaeon]|nr:hypothetical protein [DPANN group archaeon]
MANLTRLEDVLGLSGELSPDHVSNPIKIIYLPSVVETARAAKDPHQVLEEIGKFHRAALSHGFRGRSFGGKNGVVFLNKSDIDLQRASQELLDKNLDTLSGMGANINSLLPVKIVAHVENGNRLLGALDKTERPFVLYVLGFSNYSGHVV